MKKAAALSRESLYQGPAQPGAGKQGVWQARAAGVAKATSRPESGQQRRMAAAGAAGRAAFMKYAG
ncbi:hypothetical protein AAU61_02485 [Desulfocarbo indianensis]|nr:hypothetical protein AAU61_02485 [Desulfocarbo indianensis]